MNGIHAAAVSGLKKQWGNARGSAEQLLAIL